MNRVDDSPHASRRPCLQLVFAAETNQRYCTFMVETVPTSFDIVPIDQLYEMSQVASKNDVVENKGYLILHCTTQTKSLWPEPRPFWPRKDLVMI